MLRKLIDRIPFVRHHFLTTMFLLGFIVDNLTLNRVDQKFDNAVLLSYVVLAMVGILSLYGGIAERFGERASRFIREWAPALIQYSFGGLLSGMLIFYGRSSDLTVSWPYILAILIAIFGNETIRNREQRLVYNLSIFFIGLFSYVVLIVPVVIGKMGALVFVGSGFLALTIMYWFFILLTKVVPNFIELQRRNVVFVVGLIYVAFNVLYFTNVIPPIPLSLKDAGIYHNVVRVGEEEYRLTYEKPKLWEFYRESDSVFHFSPGDSIYCYASVFAPTRLSTEIFHRWEHHDTVSGKWVEYSRLSYSISGGRGEGYRGYTMISNYEEGKWRCIVETARGQVLGRETFTVAPGAKEGLVTRVK